VKRETPGVNYDIEVEFGYQRHAPACAIAEQTGGEDRKAGNASGTLSI
jgi:hypothetical protein